MTSTLTSTMAQARSSGSSELQELHTRFTAILPAIRRAAGAAFRDYFPIADREELQAETVARAWSVFRGLVARGRAPEAFLGRFCKWCVRSVRCGRRLAGQASAKDALSYRAQVIHGFSCKGGLGGQGAGLGHLADALLTDSAAPVPDQAAFRIDFPLWRSGRSGRDREVIDALAVGEAAKRVAQAHGLSPARVTQIRKEMRADWDRFCE